MPTIEEFTDDDAPFIEELAEDDDEEPPLRGGPSKEKKEPLTDLTRDGVPLTEELIRRKAEHNEGMLSTLEEIALHQLDIDKIECLNHCRCLKIVLLQNNLIRKIEGVHRLKELDYLNLALNNITRIENLEGNEALHKLDLMVNFIDLDEFHTVASLKNNSQLKELHLNGNPCQAHWESGYRDYVIATLPQIENLDGKAVSRAERIKAMQRLPELERELALLAPMAAERKRDFQLRYAQRQRDITDGKIIIDENTTEEWCIETRVADARELREIEIAKEQSRKKAMQGDPLFGDQPARERRLFKDDGTPVQMNTAKWPFSIEDDGVNIVVDVALPRFMASAAIDADVQPTYVRVTAKKQTLQLLLPEEVLTDSSKCERSSTTGHLLLTCPKIHPVVKSTAPASRPKQKAKPAIAGQPTNGGLLDAPPQGDPQATPGSGLRGSVDIRSIVPSSEKGKGGGGGTTNEALRPVLGPDFDEETDVPPLL